MIGPVIDEVMTIRPPPRFVISGSTAETLRNVDFRLVEITWSKFSAVISPSFAAGKIPAFAHRISTPPKRATATSTIFAQPPAVETSAATPIALSPAVGIQTSWQTAVVAHLVWIVPVVTLVISILVYGFDPMLEEAASDLGASRLTILREVTLPLLWPGIWSGALFAFLLSWGNFPLSLYTAGADSTIPKWLYSKMVAGYTPMVPALGTMSTLAAAALMVVAGVVMVVLKRRKAAR